MTEALKIVSRIDEYMNRNLANTAIIAVSDRNCYEFALLIVQCLANVLQRTDLSFT